LQILIYVSFNVFSCKHEENFSAISGKEQTNATVEWGDGNEIEEPVQEAQTENAPQAQGIQIEEGDDIIKEFNQDHIISDPELRILIQRFHPNIRDQVKRAYFLKGQT
jgi:hypothetical protein